MNRRFRTRVRYRPSKAYSIMGGVFGGIFVLIGIFVAIPTFGAFGILWTGLAVGITVGNLYTAFGKGYMGPDIQIEEEGSSAVNPSSSHQGESAEVRLQSLRSLYDQRLITQEEYEEKRKAILEEL